MAAGATDTALNLSPQTRLFRALQRRNRVVSVLRLAVPLFGVVVLAILVAEIVLANLTSVAGISGIRFSREAVSVDTPSYAGVMSDGTRYEITAEAASAPLSGTDVIDLKNAVLLLTRPDGGTLTAEATAAQFSLPAQTVTVPGRMQVDDSRGVDAVVDNVFIDWRAQTIFGRGGVDALFADGTTLRAATGTYRAASRSWSFDRAELTVPSGDQGE